jgi:hypothetical protein
VRTTRLVAAAVAAAVLLAAGCGSGDDELTGDSTGRAAAGTSTTTTTTTTTSTTVVSTTPTEPTGLAVGPNYVTTEGPSGSGCTPGDRTTLPDGWWAGEITSVRASGVDLDLVCFFAGDAGEKAATEDGQELTNDYYVRNNNARTFRVDFSSTTTPATCVGTDAEPIACQVNDVLTLYRTTDTTGTTMLGDTALVPFPLVWVHVGGGSGDYIYVQYTP